MLYTDTCGEGPELVLLHGWGMHSGIWQDWAGELGQWFQVTAVDLPGHGNSAWSDECELQDWVQAVQQVVPQHAWWVGWSLGGLVALAAAAHDPGGMRGVLLLAGTPKFVSGPGWSYGVDAAVFDQFGRQLEADAERALARFLSLQMRGCAGGADPLRRLRAAMKLRPTAHPDALRAGLRFLQRADQRHAMQLADLPVRWLLGERDTLIPVSVSGAFPDIPVQYVEGAGHAPFLSHPQRCSAAIRHWLPGRTGDLHASS